MKVRIYPESNYLFLSALFSSLIGIFPSQFIFEENKVLQKAYRNYSNVMLGASLAYIITAYMELVNLVCEEDPKTEEISRNLCITLLYTSVYARLIFMRIKPEFKNIIKLIIDTEKTIVSWKDEMLLKIFNESAHNTKRIIMVYFVLVWAVSPMHLIRPFYIDDYIKVGNETVAVKTLPLSSWLPFDKREHYWAAYWLNFISSLIGGSCTCYSDILMFTLIMFPTGQLEILHHVLKNFDEYKNKIKVELKQVDDDTAAFIAFRKCIDMHRDIIRYVDNFNDSMSLFMIFDFLHTSLQICSILSPLVMNVGLTLYTLEFVTVFFIAMMYRLFVSYYYANETLLLSEDLTVSIWNSKWYDESKDVKYMMHILMLKCKKTLKLKIGPFAYMTLDAFITILKASYSYMMLIYSIGRSK